MNTTNSRSRPGCAWRGLPTGALLSLVSVFLAPHAAAQLFNPSSRGGLGQAGVRDRPLVRETVNTLPDWHWIGSVAFDGSGLPLPCSTSFAGGMVDSVRTNESLTISFAGEVSGGGIVNDCGASATSRMQDEWNFFVAQPTCFTMVVTVDNTVNFGTNVQMDGAYLLIGGLQLTIGTLDAPSGIFRNFSGNVAATYTFAGTMTGGGYSVRLQGTASSGANPYSGVLHQTLSLVLGGPMIVAQPTSAVACSGGAASFTIAASGGANTFQWRKNGLPIPLGANATAQSATLIITNAAGVDAGSYECVVTGPCGGATSISAALVVCVADFDDGSGLGTCDGGVTIDDLLFYIGLVESGAVRADIDDGSFTGTPDGGVTIDDLLYYLVRFDAGC